MAALPAAAIGQTAWSAGFAAWSPDGRQVVFSGSRTGSQQLYLTTLDGPPRRLTFSDGGDISPAWSPDGQEILFVSDRDGNFELYTIRADGTGETRLTETDGSEMAPDWGPDGRIAFAFSPLSDPARVGSSSRVFVMDRDGAGRAPVLPDGVQHYPKWSPDGTRLTFSGYPTGESGAYGVWVTDFTNPPVEVSGGRGAFNAHWRPDGSRLVFVSPENGVATLFEGSPTGGLPVRLTENVEAWFEPRVSPDNAHILTRVGAGEAHRGIGLLDGRGAFVRMLVDVRLP